MKSWLHGRDMLDGGTVRGAFLHWLLSPFALNVAATATTTRQRCVIESVSWVGKRGKGDDRGSWPCVSERWIKSFVALQQWNALWASLSLSSLSQWVHNVRVALNFRHRKAESVVHGGTISTRTTAMTTTTTTAATTAAATKWQWCVCVWVCVTDKNKSRMKVAWK